jgi:hypothetical protein
MSLAMQNYRKRRCQRYKIVASEITSNIKLSSAKSLAIQNHHQQNCQQYKFIASEIANKTKYYKNDSQQFLIFLPVICRWRNEVKFRFGLRTSIYFTKNILKYITY